MGLANGVHHLAICTKDIKQQIEFFTQAVGAELVALYWMHGVDKTFHGFLKLGNSSSIAGFNMVPAESPPKVAILKSLPPLKLKYYISKQGHPVYWFADPYQCNCLYQGDEEAYQRYQNLRLQQRMVEQEQQAAELNQDAAMQMNMFNPFFFP